MDIGDCGGNLREYRTSITWKEDSIKYNIEGVPQILCDNQECKDECIEANV